MALQGYGKYTNEALEREEIELAKTFGSIFRWKVGRNPVRVLSPFEDGSPFKLVHIHFMEMGSITIPIVCPKRMINQPCPICEQADKLRTKGDAASYEKAGRYFASRKWYANAINCADPERSLIMISVGKEIMDQINGHIKTRREEDPGFDLSDPYNGVDLIVTRRGTLQEDTEYTVQLRTAKTPMGESEEVMQGYLDTRVDLEKHATPMTYELIMAKLTEVAGGTKAQPQSRGVAPTPRAAPRSIASAVTTPAASSGEDRDPAVQGYFSGDDTPPDEPEHVGHGGGYAPVGEDEDIPF